MQSCTFKVVESSDLKIIKLLAEKIWNVIYPPIIGYEQVAFMLEKMYSIESLEDQIGAKGHQIYMLLDEEVPIGFFSFSLQYGVQSNRTRLHKLYLLPDQHGKGLGAMMLNFVTTLSMLAGDIAIELNVNRFNPAIEFYTRHGFKIERAEVIEIGKGYVMDDYVMLKITDEKKRAAQQPAL